MVGIETQEDLRRELQLLMAAGLVRANGPLERRGIEVDHDLYPLNENHEPLAEYRADEADSPVSSSPSVSSAAVSIRPATRPIDDPVSATPDRIASLESTIRELREEVASVRSDFRALEDRFDDLRRQLGG